MSELFVTIILEKIEATKVLSHTVHSYVSYQKENEHVERLTFCYTILSCYLLQKEAFVIDVEK